MDRDEFRHLLVEVGVSPDAAIADCRRALAKLEAKLAYKQAVHGLLGERLEKAAVREADRDHGQAGLEDGTVGEDAEPPRERADRLRREADEMRASYEAHCAIGRAHPEWTSAQVAAEKKWLDAEASDWASWAADNGASWRR